MRSSRSPVSRRSCYPFLNPSVYSSGHQQLTKENSNKVPMITRRDAVRLLSSASAGAWLATSHTGLASSTVALTAAGDGQNPESSPGAVSVPPDSSRWLLEGEAKLAEYE